MMIYKIFIIIFNYKKKKKENDGHAYFILEQLHRVQLGTRITGYKCIMNQARIGWYPQPLTFSVMNGTLLPIYVTSIKFQLVGTPAF